MHRKLAQIGAESTPIDASRLAGLAKCCAFGVLSRFKKLLFEVKFGAEVGDDVGGDGVRKLLKSS